MITEHQFQEALARAEAAEDAQWKLIENNKALFVEIKRLRSALDFYASRTVYLKLNKFPGDNDLAECAHIAEDALRDDVKPLENWL